MALIREIVSLSDPQLAVYGSLTESALRRGTDALPGIFIAESPNVIASALDAGCEPFSLLCERKHIHGDAAALIARCGDVPIFTGAREVLASLTGYALTRGVLCAMRRPIPMTMEQVCENARRLVVVDGVTDSTNLGAIFRSAAALGIDGVLLSDTACDPLTRRALRVSMGTVFKVPWARLKGGLPGLKALGFLTAAMALHEDAIPITDARLLQVQKLAVVLGTEGEGLPQRMISTSDYVVRIPMAHGVDSLNVAAAAAVAFWQLRINDEGNEK